MNAPLRWAGESLRAPTRWDCDTVRLWVQQAADTLRRLPDRERAFIYGRQSAWPDTVRTAREAYGYSGARPKPGPPEAGAIDNMQRVILWLGWLAPNWRRILWARACGIPASRIAAMIGCNRATIWRTEKRALDMIASALNDVSGGKPRVG